MRRVSANSTRPSGWCTSLASGMSRDAPSYRISTTLVRMLPRWTPDDLADTPTLRRAAAFGVDLTLLVENLRLSPTERVRRAQRSLDSALALQAEVVGWRRTSRL